MKSSYENFAMKIYQLLGSSIDSSGGVYGYTVYSYVKKKQTNKKIIRVKRLGINPGKCTIKAKFFQLDPKFNPRFHDNMGDGCYFTSREKLVEFIQTGLRVMHQKRYDEGMELANKLHVRKKKVYDLSCTKQL